MTHRKTDQIPKLRAETDANQACGEKIDFEPEVAVGLIRVPACNPWSEWLVAFFAFIRG